MGSDHKAETMTLAAAVAFLDGQVPQPSLGLPDEVFYYVSRTTPLVNVDLLIQAGRRTLLAWRDDAYAGRGWHVPGGIVRFKEPLEVRLRKVTTAEIGADVSYDPKPLALHEILNPSRANRGHFISILYRCSLPPDFVPDNASRRPTDPGYLAWHEGCPEDLIRFHDMYRAYIDEPVRTEARQ